MEIKTAKNERHAKWQALIEEQEKSGLSRLEFCKQRSLAKSNFAYYKSILSSGKTTKKEVATDKLFSAIQIKQVEVQKHTEIKILLPNGFQCVIPSGMNISSIKQLVEACSTNHYRKILQSFTALSARKNLGTTRY